MVVIENRAQFLTMNVNKPEARGQILVQTLCVAEVRDTQAMIRWKRWPPRLSE